jgi:dipeptidyl aminopeptidase/acylaminoacyl peptidase
MLRIALAFVLALAAVPAAAQVNVDALVRKDRFKDIVISPDGTYYAVTVPSEDGTGLLVIRRADKSVATAMNLGRDIHVHEVWWVNDERILYSIAEQFGSLDTPMPTGELFAVNAAGGKPEILVGQRVENLRRDSRLSTKKEEMVAAALVDDLPADDRNVIISVAAFTAEPTTRAERMDVYTGKRTPITRAPVPRARFVTDNAGAIRFAHGHGGDNQGRLYYRANDDAEWVLANDEGVSGVDERPIGFSADNAVAYLQAERKDGPDAIVAFDPATQARTDVLRDAHADPAAILFAPDGSGAPVGVRYVDGTIRTAFFDEASKLARQQHALEGAFKGLAVDVTSATRDGRLLMVGTSSARNPGDFFVFDTVAKNADLVISRRNWINPEALSDMRPVELTARDGLVLRGYLTLPPGSDGKNLPAVVLPHGGPFGYFDQPYFDDDAQILAQAGYAVLQVNYRGSGNYGRRFRQAGAREWGGAMQDDLTDATKWLAAQGIADASRICIYGASYGAYAALAGVAREPSLYKCAAGLVGVYDLREFAGDRGSRSSATYVREWIGEGDALDAASPVHLAGRIKVPVFLSAGGEDFIAPIAHTRKMEAALKRAGVPVATLYYPNEGHGYYVEAHRREFYATLLDFLATHIGGKRAAPAKADKSP